MHKKKSSNSAKMSKMSGEAKKVLIKLSYSDII